MHVCLLHHYGPSPIRSLQLPLHPAQILCRFFFFFQAEDGIRDIGVTGVQTCALPIFHGELATLGIKVAPSTIWEILKTNGTEPAPERDRQTWAAFLRSQARAILAADLRSEERRVGKECRSRWSPYH